MHYYHYGVLNENRELANYSGLMKLLILICINGLIHVKVEIHLYKSIYQLCRSSKNKNNHNYKALEGDFFYYRAKNMIIKAFVSDT